MEKLENYSTDDELRDIILPAIPAKVSTASTKKDETVDPCKEKKRLWRIKYWFNSTCTPIVEESFSK